MKNNQSLQEIQVVAQVQDIKRFKWYGRPMHTMHSEKFYPYKGMYSQLVFWIQLKHHKWILVYQYFCQFLGKALLWCKEGNPIIMNFSSYSNKHDWVQMNSKPDERDGAAFEWQVSKTSACLFMWRKSQIFSQNELILHVTIYAPFLNQCNTIDSSSFTQVNTTEPSAQNDNRQVNSPFFTQSIFGFISPGTC